MAATALEEEEAVLDREIAAAQARIEAKAQQLQAMQTALRGVKQSSPWLADHTPGFKPEESARAVAERLWAEAGSVEAAAGFVEELRQHLEATPPE